MSGLVKRLKSLVLSPFKGQFLKYNLVIGVSWIIGYILTVWLVDFMHYKAYIVVLAVGVILHLLRFVLLFEDNAKEIFNGAMGGSDETK